jgi:dUTP pyrophosphatase
MNDERKLIENCSAVMDHDALLALCIAQPPLVEPFDPAMLQPNGLELSLESVWRMARYGSLPAPGAGERTFPDYYAIKPDREAWWHLEKGCYKVIYNEYVRIPSDLCAMARSRSSLLRMGAWIATALWDSGYEGRSESLLVVENPAGIRIQRGARLIQLVFFALGKAAGKLYQGRYKGENR